MTDFAYTDLLPLGEDTTDYRLVSTDGVSTVDLGGTEFLKVEPEALRALTSEAMVDIAHFLRTSHLTKLAAILDDAEASPNDKFVATELLKNASIAAGGVLPMCQDTGTVIVSAKKGRKVYVTGDDHAALSAGAKRAYAHKNLRYSQLAPLSMYQEKNTGDNLPGQIDIMQGPDSKAHQ